jgi:hypothetical protein
MRKLHVLIQFGIYDRSRSLALEHGNLLGVDRAARSTAAK